MIKKIEMLEKAELVLAGGDMTADKKSRFPRALVESVLANGYDILVAQMFEQSREGIFPKDQAMLDAYSKTYYAPDDFSVNYNSTTNEWYAILPKPVIILKDNEAIRLIYPIGNRNNAGVPTTGVGAVIRSSLVVSQINSRFTFYQRSNKIIFNFPVTPITNMAMDLVVPFDELEDNDYIDEPSIMTKGGAFTVYDFVKQQLLTMPQTKQTEDNTP